MNLNNHNSSEPHGGAVTAPLTGPGAVIAEASSRLQAVGERLRQFLQQKLAQFEAAATHCNELLVQRQTISTMREELTREKSEWEHRQQEQINEIRGEQERLIKSWQKVEDQQRRIHSQQNMPQHQLQGGAIPATPMAIHETIAAVNPNAPLNGESVFVEPVRPQANPAAVALSREEAMAQFQRLKRDCRKHVQRVQPGTNGNQ